MMPGMYPSAYGPSPYGGSPYGSPYGNPYGGSSPFGSPFSGGGVPSYSPPPTQFSGQAGGGPVSPGNIIGPQTHPVNSLIGFPPVISNTLYDTHYLGQTHVGPRGGYASVTNRGAFATGPDSFAFMFSPMDPGILLDAAAGTIPFSPVYLNRDFY